MVPIPQKEALLQMVESTVSQMMGKLKGQVVHDAKINAMKFLIDAFTVLLGLVKTKLAQEEKSS